MFGKYCPKSDEEPFFNFIVDRKNVHSFLLYYEFFN